MRIAVCMKQVPAYSEGNMDEKTGLIIRSGLESIVNVYDLAALETALQIKEQCQAQVEVFTMGPESAAAVLREAYAMGADQGYLISDRAFGGADVLATSYTLMQALECKGGYDLILCGKQTTDGDTAQVSGALATWLGIPHFTGVTKLIGTAAEQLEIEQLFEREILSWRVDLPCLLAVDREIFPVRMPSLKLRMAGKKKEIIRIGLTDFADPVTDHYGLKGSATKVKKIFPPVRTARQEVKQLDGKAAAADILQTVQQIRGKEEKQCG